MRMSDKRGGSYKRMELTMMRIEAIIRRRAGHQQDGDK